MTKKKTGSSSSPKKLVCKKMNHHHHQENQILVQEEEQDVEERLRKRKRASTFGNFLHGPRRLYNFLKCKFSSKKKKKSSRSRTAPSGVRIRVTPPSTSTLRSQVQTTTTSSAPELKGSSYAYVRQDQTVLSSSSGKPLPVYARTLINFKRNIKGPPSKDLLPKTSNILNNNNQDEDESRIFKSLYRLQKPLNEGSFCKVYLAKHRFTNESVAVKKVDLATIQMKDLRRTTTEIEALQTLDHPNVCKLYQVFHLGKETLSLVLESCDHDLFDLIHRGGRVKEKDGRRIFAQVVSAVEAIHQEGYIHRDLKPENVLFDSRGNVKLIDFNLSVRAKKKGDGEDWRMLRTHCGTIEYAAPELVSDEEFYEGIPVDCWSLGVLLFVMLVGKFPFVEPAQRFKIMCATYDLPSHLSSESSSLIQGLLQLEPKDRLTPSQILRHPWLSPVWSSKKNHKKNPKYLYFYPYEVVKGSGLNRTIVELMSSTLNIPLNTLSGILAQGRYNSFELGLYNILLRKMEILGPEDFALWQMVWKSERQVLDKIGKGKSSSNKLVLLKK